MMQRSVTSRRVLEAKWNDDFLMLEDVEIVTICTPVQ
jgi:hypothetical protein